MSAEASPLVQLADAPLVGRYSHRVHTPAVAILDDAVADRLRAQPLTYREIGATRGELPRGYRHLHRETRIGSGRSDFDRAAHALMHWQVQLRAGLRVRASQPEIDVDVVALQTLGWSPFTVKAPVRVVDVVRDGDRVGFAYGTLPGHQESGEERFEIDIRADGAVFFAITAFSTPATALARLSGPVGHAVQNVITRRYAAALRRA